ncbi:MAG: hypothetical protein AAGF56_03390 [Pseudomonadota bacterium]
MNPSLFDDLPLTQNRDVDRYLTLTKKVMPAIACRSDVNWPVSADHCFQRIVLDALFKDVWYRHLGKPAYRHLTPAQAARAVALCEDIIAGRVDLHALNAASLQYRGKER